MRIPHNSLVVIADGRKLLFFRNEGEAMQPHLTVVKKATQLNPSDHDQKTDLAGRAPGGNSMSEPDYHQLEEDRFAAEASDMLRRRALENDYEDLIIVAPPKTLGEMRKHYHVEVEKRLVGEVAKDLTGHPVDEIARLLLAGGLNRSAVDPAQSVETHAKCAL